MASRKLAYATAASITGTLTSLAAGAYRMLAAVDNTTNLYLEAFAGGRVQIGAVTADGQIEFYAYASWDGTLFTAGLDGTDKTLTWGTDGGQDSYQDLVPLGSVAVDATDDNDDVEFGPFSIATVYGGRVPPKWGIIIKNGTNVAFHATGTNNQTKYTGVYETIT